MISVVRIITATLVLAGLTIPARAEDLPLASPAGAGKPVMARLMPDADANGDGQLSLMEIHAKYPNFPEARFQKLDRNQNGNLEASELPHPDRGADGGIAKRMKAADTDKDGRISPQEFAAAFPNAPADRFAKADTDGNGFLEPADRKEIPGPGTRPAAMEPGKAADKTGLAESGSYLSKLLHQCDGDQDGRVTAAEVAAAKPGFPADAFTAMDRDHDGVLSKADTAAANTSAGAPKAKKEAPKPQSAAPGKGEPGKDAKKPEKVAAKAGKNAEKVKMDLNKDGAISFEEASQANPEFTRERFDARDKNGDGVLSKADRAKE